MYEACLEQADLSSSVLMEADMSSANLRSADLSSADLTSANLTNADLSQSNLASACLTGAQLRNANLYGSNLSGVDLSDADMRSVRGLEAICGRPKTIRNAKIDSETLAAVSNLAIGKLLVRESTIDDHDFRYDIALSFAGEDRDVAQVLAQALQMKRLRVFYDEYEKANLWGKNLCEHLTHVYRDQARSCIILVSKHYATKQWTTLERRAAQSRAFEDSREYILPVRLDETDITGILSTVGYIRWTDESPMSIARLAWEKVKEQRGT